MKSYGQGVLGCWIIMLATGFWDRLTPTVLQPRDPRPLCSAPSTLCDLSSPWNLVHSLPPRAFLLLRTRLVPTLYACLRLAVLGTCWTFRYRFHVTLCRKCAELAFSVLVKISYIDEAFELTKVLQEKLM